MALDVSGYKTGQNNYDDQGLVVKHTRLVKYIIYTKDHKTKPNYIEFEGDLTFKDLQLVVNDIIGHCDLSAAKTSGTFNYEPSEVMKIMIRIVANCDVMTFTGAVETLQARIAAVKFKSEEARQEHERDKAREDDLYEL